jgi:hypothetical protein
MGMFGSNPVTYENLARGLNLPNDSDDWTCANLKNYYLEVKKVYGKEKAKQTFESDISDISFFATANNCKYDCEWMNFFKDEGLNGGNIISNIFCGASNVAKTVNNSTDAISKSTDNVGKTVSFLTNPVFLVVGLGVAGYWWAKKKKYIK